MRVLRCAAAGTLVVMLAAGCGPRAAPGAPPAVSARNDSGSSVFAFNTPHALSVVRNGIVVSTAETAQPPRNPVFTADGRYVAAAADDGTVVVAGTDAQSARTVPAQAKQVFAGRGATIIWWQAPNQLLSLDLSQPS